MFGVNDTAIKNLQEEIKELETEKEEKTEEYNSIMLELTELESNLDSSALSEFKDFSAAVSSLETEITELEGLIEDSVDSPEESEFYENQLKSKQEELDHVKDQLENFNRIRF
jgi:chromosome segregation ATPase